MLSKINLAIQEEENKPGAEASELQVCAREAIQLSFISEGIKKQASEQLQIQVLR